MPLLTVDSFAYQFYRTENPQNDRSPDIVTVCVNCTCLESWEKKNFCKSRK
jgi:hypothetical protein